MAYMTQQLGLSRSTLLSLLVMVSTVGIFATGATFAAWTASDTATGTVTAATVSIDVFGDGAGGVLLFDDPIASCPQPMRPNDTCTATVTVTNAGSLPVSLTFLAGSPSVATTDAQGVAGCLPSHWSVVEGSQSLPAGLAAGASGPFSLDVTLSASAPDGCQGETATVSVTVVATEGA